MSRSFTFLLRVVVLKIVYLANAFSVCIDANAFGETEHSFHWKIYYKGCQAVVSYLRLPEFCCYRATALHTVLPRPFCPSDKLGAFFFNGPGRSRHVIDGPGPTDLAWGKRTVTFIAYRLFHSPAKDLRYAAAANHINRQRSTLQ